MSVINTSDLDARAIAVQLKEENLEQRHAILNEVAQSQEAFKESVIELLQGFIGKNFVLVEKSELEDLLDEIEEAKSDAEGAQDTLSSISNDISSAESYAEDAYSKADNAYDKLKDIINGLV
jgi:DNA repair ATPase RecN